MHGTLGPRLAVAIVALALATVSPSAGAQNSEPFRGSLEARAKWADESAEGPGPTILSATPLSDTAVVLAWTSVGGAAGYRALRRAGVEEPWIPLHDGLLSESEFTDSSVAPAATYSYIVEAHFPHHRAGASLPVDVEMSSAITYEEQSDWWEQP